MPANHLRLITLGRLALVSASGADASLTRRRRQLAVLAVLALSARPVSRTRLVEMFWGDEDEARARHSLSNALSSLRALLGAPAITTLHGNIALSGGSSLDVDAVELAAACEMSDSQRAIGLYTGPFLDGVSVPNSPEFDKWAARERARLARLFLQACESHCGALSRAERWDECAAVAARWLDVLPPSRVAATMLLSAIAAPGTNDSLNAALTAYDQLVFRLENKYESPPDIRVTALAAELRERLRHRSSATTTVVTPGNEPVPELPLPSGGGRNSSVGSAPSREASPVHNGRENTARIALPRIHSRRMRIAAAVILAGATGTLALRAWSTHDHSAVPLTRPLVVVANVSNVRADTSLAWLEEGLKQMIAADLSRSDVVDVVSPSRVRDVIARAGYSPGTSMSTERATDVARRVGATWAVMADISHGGGGYVLGFSVFKVADSKLLRVYTVTGSDIVSVAAAAAARVLDVADESATTPHFADIETSSPAAYRHFVRGMQASAAGQHPQDEQELDAALALDPGFVSAITARRDVALRHDNFAMAVKMDSAFVRAAGRASNWDRMMEDAVRSVRAGETVRGEALSRQLVVRYPRDPRGYVFLSTILMGHGKWLAADTVLAAELALDSLAVEAGNGPCAPCLAYRGLTVSQTERGDFTGAERAARKWVELQPDLPDAWVTLADALATSNRPDEAITAGKRGVALTSAAYPAVSIGRWMIMGRRYDAADEYATVLRSSTNPRLR
ncbi:MAG: BTAD domain-containing putative transcriptional regulator, partial [Gemmatimonadaceae bacterium]